MAMKIFPGILWFSRMSASIALAVFGRRKMGTKIENKDSDMKICMRQLTFNATSSGDRVGSYSIGLPTMVLNLTGNPP